MKKAETIKPEVLDFRLSQFINQGGNNMQTLLQSSNMIQSSSFGADKILFTENSQPEGIFYLRRGNIRLVQNNHHGENIEVGCLPEGSYLGLASLIRNKKHSATAIAQTDCQIEFVPRDEFFRLMSQHPLFSHQILVGLCKLLTQTEEEISKMQCAGIKQKLAETLLVLCRNLKPAQKTPAIQISAADLAKLVNTDIQIVKEYLKDFQENKYLRIENSMITLLDKEGLKTMTNPSSESTK